MAAAMGTGTAARIDLAQQQGREDPSSKKGITTLLGERES